MRHGPSGPGALPVTEGRTEDNRGRQPLTFRAIDYQSPRKASEKELTFNHPPPPLSRAVIAVALLASAVWPLTPIGAAPRLTLELRQSDLHGTLRRLGDFYGRKLTGPHGEGTDAFREDAAAARASFQWKDAPLGAVLREVAQAYRLTPRMEQSGDIRFLTGVAPPSGRTQRGQQLSVTLQRIDQEETRTQVAGVAKPQVERAVTLHLTLRTHGADAERIHAISHAQAQDGQGRRWELLEAPRPPDLPATARDLPDERSTLLRMTGLPAGIRELAAVEGTVLLYRSLTTHRFEVPLTGQVLPPMQTQGSLRFRTMQLDAGAGQIGGSAALGWPDGTEVLLPEAGAPVVPICRVRLRGGRLLPLEARVQRMAGVDGLAHGARLTLVPAVLPEEPVALVWDLTARSQPDLEVPFRFDAVPLPLAGPDSPIPARGTSSLLIRLGPSISQQEGELSVGLSQRGPSSWGPVRWRTLEVAPGSTPRIAGLAPGSYRVSLRWRRRGADGRLQPPVPLTGSSPKTIQILPGRETPLYVAP